MDRSQKRIDYYFIAIDGENVDPLGWQAGELPGVHIYQGDCNQLLLETVYPRVRYEDYRRDLLLYHEPDAEPPCQREGPRLSEREKTASNVEAVVFDLGGVLIDWDPRYLYRRIFDSEEETERFLTTVCTPEWNAELDRGRSFEEMVALLCSKHPEMRGQIEAYRLRWGEMLGECFEGSVKILEELHSAGYPLYALTNWSAETFHIARERYGFLSHFRVIIVSGEVGLIKPEPTIYELLVERTGIDPSRTVFIDDREENARAAEKIGFVSVTYQEPSQLRQRLTELGLLK